MTGPGGSLSQLTATPASASQRNASTPGFCCSIEVSLDTIKQNHPAYGTGGGLAIEVPGAPSPAARPLLSVVDAVKAHDGSGSSYTAYLIRYGDRELKRRYSDFASLRKSLAKLYPTLLLPPIPEKHSLADYATKPTRAKQDPVTIDKRKRMLASFLNRLAWHPILAADHLVHRFLDPAALWADVLHAAKVASLPQKSSATGAGGTAAGPALVAVDGAGGGGGGARPAATAVKRPDPKFVDAEAFTHKFETVIKDSVEKPHRRLARRYAEVCSDYAELSAAYNALSLSEAPAVAAALDKVGTAYDTMHASTARLSHGMEETIGERWHEYVQFAEVVKGVLRYRTELQLALEGTIDALESKRAALAQLERADADAQRLVDALRREGYASAGSSSPISGATSPLPPVPPGATAIGASGPASSAEYHLHESTTGRRSGLPPATGGTGIVAALSDKLSAMLDNDPEATRRSNLAKTRDVVALLEQQRERQANDVVQAAEAVAHDLDRFQRQKMHDVRAILLATARTHAEWARRNLRGWTDAREYVGAVPSDLE
ncbi:hypothetical protein BC828DRAFT_347220 [Blastocladiella britannica]|nr:hypothetical protein BC828DRAFT_347220 [Blastocladiella britannica]